jgi:hypothetical protein
MAHLRLRRRHGDARSVTVKCEFERVGFDAIVEQGRRAVQVHVVDVFRFATSICERQAHRTRRLVAVFSQTHAMIGIARGAITRDLRIDRGTAIERVLQLLKNVNPGTLT